MTVEEKAKVYALDLFPVKDVHDRHLPQSEYRLIAEESFTDGYNEAMRWREVEKELPYDGQEILCKNDVYKEVNTYYSYGVFDEEDLRLRFTHWRPINMWDMG